jgi:hypothetical protein
MSIDGEGLVRFPVLLRLFDWLKFKNPHACGPMQVPIHSRSPEALFLGLPSARRVAPGAATWQS